MTEDQLDFRRWLFKKYLAYLDEEGYPRSVADFASKFGISRSVMSLLLLGKREPSKNVLDALSKEYGEKVYEVAKRHSEESVVRKINNYLEGLDQEQKQEVINRLSRGLK